MTQRSILAGTNPTVIIKAGLDVSVKGHESDLVMAETSGRWGLKIEKHSASEFARARAAVGEHVLFDLRFKKPSPASLAGEYGSEEDGEVIEVHMGGSGEVLVPVGANVKVYAGKNIAVQGVQGQVDGYAGLRLSFREVDLLGHASAGGTMELDCQRMLGEETEFKAGGDLRFRIRDLTSAYVRVKDLGGYWEARIGGGEKSVYLKCGGDVTLVTDQKVEPLPPHYILGKIEKPATA